MNTEIFNKFENLIFVIQNPSLGTAINRGIWPNNYFSEHNLRSHCVTEHFLQNQADLTSIKNSIIIVVKEIRNTDLIEKLKQQNNKIALDCLDGYAHSYGAKSSKTEKLTPNFINDIYDAYILNTKKMLKDVTSFLPTNTFGDVLYTFSDPRIRKNKEEYDQKNPPFDETRAGYIGAAENFLYGEDPYIKKSITPEFNIEKQNEMSSHFNCHYSIRIKDSWDFLYKPSSKLSTACAANANIIHTRDCCASEILGEDYPYFTESDIDAVKDCVHLAKESFGSEIWNKGLEMISEARETLSINNICGASYPKFLEKLLLYNK